MDETDGTVSLAKRGDVILCVGGEEQGTFRILVSSASMSVASSVFEAMFYGRFAEGQALSSTNPREIALPDDSPTSMLLLCQIIHMKTSDIPRQLELNALADFAILCDKYDCVDAVRAWSRVWVLELLAKPEAPGFEKLIMVTYALDLPDEFCKVTRSLIINRTFSVDIEVAAHGTDFVPLKAFGLSTHNKHLLNSHSHHAAQLQKGQSFYYNKVGPALMPQRLSEMVSYTCAHSVFTLHMVNARRADIFPATTVSIQQYRDRCTKMSRLSNSTCENGYGCPCRYGDQLQENTLASIEDVIRSVQGMCLDCVCSVGQLDGREQCRAQHTKLPY